MKLEVGMYVRLQNDAENIVIINRIANVFETTILTENDGSIYQGEYTKENVIKASYSIIDILEVGDVIIDSVGKHEVLLIDDELMIRNTGLIYDNNYYLPIKSIAIKSVITREQMEQMAYKVGE